MTEVKKVELENFLMGEDSMLVNIEEKVQLELDFPLVGEDDGKELTPIIVDRKVITESGKILLKD